MNKEYSKQQWNKLHSIIFIILKYKKWYIIKKNYNSYDSTSLGLLFIFSIYKKFKGIYI